LKKRKIQESQEKIEEMLKRFQSGGGVNSSLNVVIISNFLFYQT
jgi:hypothetical protein